MNAKRNSAGFLTSTVVIVRTVLPVVVGLGLLIVIIAWLAGAFHDKQEPERHELVATDVSGLQTELVHEVSKQHIEEAVGTLKAASRTVISTQLLAVIEEVSVVAGQQVKKDDVLVRLQDRELRAQLQQAEQALVATTANRVDAEKDLARSEALRKTRAVAKSALEESERRLDVTRAEEQRAKEAVQEASVRLSYTTITAPRPGRVIDRLVQPGDTIRPGDPILVLYDETSLRLEAAVPERLAAQMELGEVVQVYVDARSEEYEATIDEIVPQADATSRSFIVKAALPPSVGLFEGMFGRLRIPVGERRHLCLPTAAILRMGQLEFVEVVSGELLLRRMIQTGRMGMPGRVEVLSGLRAGEEVVVHDSVIPSPEADETE